MDIDKSLIIFSEDLSKKKKNIKISFFKIYKLSFGSVLNPYAYNQKKKNVHVSNAPCPIILFVRTYKF